MSAPTTGGTYIVLVELPSPTTIRVGRIGSMVFEAGAHAYVGSAHGPGGLAARLRRYEVGPRRIHWHIDYLLQTADAVGALFRSDPRRRECSWARWIANRAQGCVPGFGSSDCQCASHLYLVGSARAMDVMIGAASSELKAYATYWNRCSASSDAP